MTARSIRLILILLSLYLLLSACQDSPGASITNTTLPSEIPNPSPATFVIPATPTNPPPEIITPLPTAGEMGVRKTALPAATAQDWEYRWLKAMPCRPPCWEGITPGKTTAREAYALVQKNPLMVKTVLEEQRGLVGWEWAPNIKGPGYTPTDYGGGISFPTPNAANIVFRIRPEFKKTFKLDEILAAYGEPSHIRATYDFQAHSDSGVNSNDTNDIFTLVYVFDLVYLPQGFHLTYRGGAWPDFTKSLPMENLEFFVPGMQGYLAVNYNGWSKLLVPWEKGKDFLYHCRFSQEGYTSSSPVEKCHESLKTAP